MCQVPIQEAVCDRDSGERGASIEEAECEEESETNFLALWNGHFKDVREDERNEPDVGAGVNYCRGGHDGVIGEALPVGGKWEPVCDGVADHCRERYEDGTIDTDEADGAPD